MRSAFTEAMDVFKDVFFYSQQLVVAELTHEFQKLSPEQLAVLLLLDLSGSMTSKEIAQFQGTHKSAVSNRLKKLQKKQFISFEADRYDNRVKHVNLTELGEKQMQLYNEEVLSYFEELFSDFQSSEIEQFTQLLGKVRDRLKQHSPVSKEVNKR
ncbi:MarR family transcriptional regulator [Bacillus sp. JCM 19041]|uniref:MarR family winged helix-turn-helix transcriptional regulator n=1 Tax=Bacillus sp. JCM 19041 TaxID=1460637 RepID=UPI0006CF86A2